MQSPFRIVFCGVNLTVGGAENTNNLFSVSGVLGRSMRFMRACLFCGVNTCVILKYFYRIICSGCFCFCYNVHPECSVNTLLLVVDKRQAAPFWTRNRVASDWQKELKSNHGRVYETEEDLLIPSDRYGSGGWDWLNVQFNGGQFKRSWLLLMFIVMALIRSWALSVGGLVVVRLNEVRMVVYLFNI